MKRRAQRIRRIAVATLTTVLVSVAAWAFYAAILNGGSGTVQTSPFGANTQGTFSFKLVVNPNVPLPTNLQPGASCAITSPGNDCGSFNLLLDNTGNPVGGTLVSVTLAGIDLPPGCPADSLHVIWPDGSVDGTYTEPAGLVTFTANSPASNTDVFPSFVGARTQSAQPLLWFKDDGQNQNACAGGAATLHFTGANS